jgi:hypothetical protein
MERICNLCSSSSFEVRFYKGVTSRCADCHKAKVREDRANNPEYYRAYDARRFQNDPKVKERHKRYQASEAGKRSLETSRKKWTVEHPAERAAHVILGNSVRDGKVIKPLMCSVCGCGGRIHGHHDDYTKPLDVIWCCPKCHTDIHRKKTNATSPQNP